MKKSHHQIQLNMIISVTVLCFTQPVFAFDSGSTGADGVFNPISDTVLNVPEPDGVFNFISVDIPLGVTVTFARNTTNTPVTILSSGDVRIDGTLSVDGGDSPDVGTAGDSNLADDGLPGLGGPGGFNGGTGGGLGSNISGSDGQGPGGGKASTNRDNRDFNFGCGGGGAGFSSDGLTADRGTSAFAVCSSNNNAIGGLAYGTGSLLSLIGGSGGGGAANGNVYRGSGGGGGGGAILIAATGAVTINGAITAIGGDSGDSAGQSSGGTGGAGSGGAIRVIGAEIIGNGIVNVDNGLIGTSSNSSRDGGGGGDGRVRFESSSVTFSGNIIPVNNSSVFSVSNTPGKVFIAGMPSLSITSIGGQTAPALPAGNLDPANADITLPDTTTNPVTVEFATSGVPVDGTTAVDLTVLPEFATAITATSTPLSGNETAATASASVTIPDGLSVLQASLSFTVTVAMGNEFSRFAEGEQVAKVKLNVNEKGQSETTFITISGKEFTWSSNTVAMR